MIAPAKVPSITTMDSATCVAKRAICGLPAPNSLETLALTDKNEKKEGLEKELV